MKQKKGQVTIFIIVGLIIFFAFLALIGLQSTLEKEQLQGQKEALVGELFKKEALRLYVTQCVEKSLEDGMIALGQKGRLFATNPAGVQDNQGNFIVYGLERGQKAPQYPCRSDENAPSYCRYQFPNTSITFGTPKLNLRMIERDLEKHVSLGTLGCIQEFVDRNISQAIVVDAQELDLNLNLLPGGIRIVADYPLEFTLQGQRLFQLTSFDLFYPTQFQSFLQTSVLLATQLDYQHADFPLTESSLTNSVFWYRAATKEFAECRQKDNSFECPFYGLQPDLFKQLGITLTESHEEKADIFSFSSPSILRGKAYTYNLARENRPPALDYISRAACPTSNFDYLVVQGHPEFGKIEVTPFAVDADEDAIARYTFSWLGLSEREANPFVQEVTQAQRGTYDLEVKAYDEHGAYDSQQVRVFVDTPAKTNATLRTPYTKQGEQATVVSLEDPLFVNLTFSGRGEKAGTLYSGREVTLSFVPNSGDVVELGVVNELDVSTQKCLGFPARTLADKRIEAGCDLERFTSLISQKLQTAQGYDKSLGTGKLLIKTTLNYCDSTQQVTQTIEIPLTAQACSPHKNELYPFPYPYHTYQRNKEGKLVNLTSEKAPNPYLATHACCTDQGDYEPATKPCFTNPTPGCYGQVRGLTDARSDLAGYLVEEQIRLCSGTRGNVCDGVFANELPNKINLVCGRDDQPSCSKVNANCEGDNAYSLDGKGWCTGTLGCQTYCTGNNFIVIDQETYNLIGQKNPEEYARDVAQQGYSALANFPFQCASDCQKGQVKIDFNGISEVCS